MIFGHNTNVTLHDVVYHVQTEDRGAANALIETTVYCRGRVLHRLTNNYFDLLPLDPDKEAALKLRLDEQHRTVLNEIRTGALVLTPPPDPGAPPTPAPRPNHLLLELTNAKSWLKGKHAVLYVAVKSSAGAPVAGATVNSKVEGAASPADCSVVSAADGIAHLEFDIPRLADGEPAIVIEAAHGTASGHLRFQLRAKPRVSAS